MWPFPRKPAASPIVTTRTTHEQVFEALEDFEVPRETGVSRYRRGMHYSVRPGNDRLAAEVKEWLTQDPPIVRLLDVRARVQGAMDATMRGKARVL